MIEFVFWYSRMVDGKKVLKLSGHRPARESGARIEIYAPRDHRSARGVTGSGEESQRAKERAAKKASRKQERAPGKQSGPTTPP